MTKSKWSVLNADAGHNEGKHSKTDIEEKGRILRLLACIGEVPYRGCVPGFGDGGLYKDYARQN